MRVCGCVGMSVCVCVRVCVYRVKVDMHVKSIFVLVPNNCTDSHCKRRRITLFCSR